MGSSTEHEEAAHAELWTRVAAIFARDDGSLPELDLAGLGEEVDRVFECLRRDETRPFPDSQYLWLRATDEDVPLRLVERPAAEVVAGASPSFHCTLVNVTVNGRQLPEIGVSVFPDLISLDYRMGEGWNASTVALLLSRLAECIPESARVVVWDIWPDNIRLPAQEAIDEFMSVVRRRRSGG